MSDALLKRVEAASGPDRELDDALSRALSGVKGAETDHWYDFWGVWTSAGTTPHYTASLDAAIALCEKVLPDHRWIIDSDLDRGPRYAAQVKVRGQNWSERPRHFGYSPALALLAAILKATAA